MWSKISAWRTSIIKAFTLRLVEFLDFSKSPLCEMNNCFVCVQVLQKSLINNNWCKISFFENIFEIQYNKQRSEGEKSKIIKIISFLYIYWSIFYHFRIPFLRGLRKVHITNENLDPPLGYETVNVCSATFSVMSTAVTIIILKMYSVYCQSVSK